MIEVGTMDKMSTLEECSFYRKATPVLRSKIVEAATYAVLPAGKNFYSEGEMCGHFAFVGRGNIRVFKTAESGRQMTLYHVQDREPCLVNLLCLFLGRPAMASAVVEAPTEAIVVDGGVFRNWLDNHAVVRHFVFEAMARRLVEVMTLVEEIAFAKMDHRVAGLLLRRFSHDRALTVTHEELAAELGTAREVVSRLLKDFERMGAILMTRGRLELRDASLLQDYAERS
jgi:CRP/FNR family transcriptional regulator, anaerobic regulatory protein